MIKTMFAVLTNFKRFLPRRTIRVELIITLICTALIPAIIVNLYYNNKMSLFIEERVKAYNTEIIRQTGEKLDSLVSEMEIAKTQSVDFLITSEGFVDYDFVSPMEKIDMVKQTEKLLSGLEHAFTGISYIYLIGSDGRIYSTNPNCDKEKLADEPWIRNASGKEFLDIVIPTHNANYYDAFNSQVYMPVVSFVKKITWYGKNNFMGIIQIDMKYSEISRIIESVDMGANSYMLVLDENNTVICCPDEQYLGRNAGNTEYDVLNIKTSSELENSIEKKNAFAIEYKLVNTNWKLIGVISMDNMFMKLGEIANISLVIIFIALGFSIFISYLLSKRITSPITRIITRMKAVGEGQFDICMPKSKNEDLQILTTSFAKMVNKIELLMKDMVDKEKEKTRLELKALQSQINPHFLYNTLNTIKWMALMEKPYPSLVKATMSLGEILKYSYESCDNLIQVREEIDFLENYIYIQQLRYGEDIRVKYEIDEKLYEDAILKFLLQPIVENSIIHGLAGKKGQGEITIRGFNDRDRLVFEVEDNGVGVNLSNKEMFTGLGIDNVNTRIKLNFGAEYGLYMDSSPGKGTRVTMIWPRIDRGRSIP